MQTDGAASQYVDDDRARTAGQRRGNRRSLSECCPIWKLGENRLLPVTEPNSFWNIAGSYPLLDPGKPMTANI